MRTPDVIRADMERCSFYEASPSREWASGRLLDDVPHLLAEVEGLRAEVKRLRAVILEAAELIVEWGTYADMYFQEKWGLAADAARIRAAARPGGAA